MRQVIEAVEKASGRKIVAADSSRRPGDPSWLLASSQKINEELGWTPKYPDLEMIVKTAYD